MNDNILFRIEEPSRYAGQVIKVAVTAEQLAYLRAFGKIPEDESQDGSEE